MDELFNYDVQPPAIYQQYAPPVTPIITPIIEGGGVSPVTIINGNGGSGASGPNVTLSGGSTGYIFDAQGQSITLQVNNAATIRTTISAAASGVNTDITQLNGASQVDVSGVYKVDGTQVVQERGAAVPDATGGVTVDAEARAAINALLARLRAHGLIGT